MSTVIGRPFVKRFALCYRIVVCVAVLSVCNVGVWSNGWMNQDETWHAGIGLGPSHTVLDGDPALPSSPQFLAHVCYGAMSVMAKGLDGSRCHLLGRQISVLATLCYMGTQPTAQWDTGPIFGPCVLWPNGWIDQYGTW